MASVINTNVSSLNAQRNLSGTQNSLATSLQRLSTGLRINSAKDDAAGLAISERMTSQIRGLNQASRNANDAISLAQTAEGAMGQATDLLQRIRELSIQSANATNSASDRAALQEEVGQLTSELDRISTTTQFNGLNLLDGTFSAQQFQVGANANQTISVGISSIRTSDIGAYVSAAGDATSVVHGDTDTADANLLTNGNFTFTTSAASYTGITETAIASNNVVINGTNIQGSADYTGASTYQGDGSAYAKAAAVNGSGVAGVTATATNSQTFTATTNGFLELGGDIAGDATLTYSLTVNGESVYNVSDISATGTTSAITIDSAVAAINTTTADSKVTASKDDSGNLVLTSSDGRDIAIKETVVYGDTASSGEDDDDVSFTSVFTSRAFIDADNSDESDTLAVDLTFAGNITLNSSDDITINQGQAVIGFASTAINATGSVDAVDVSTVAGANAAILAMDSALTTINSSRATLGATQSRFEATVSNLQSTSENISAARSRIRDADFAQETANLTRAQILQQAGTAMLSQANSLPQNVLSLLG